MKVNVMSDLHLEFGNNLSLPGGDVLLLAGDICVASNFMKQDHPHHVNAAKRAIDFTNNEFTKYDKVFGIMGNHEHYHGVFNNTKMVLDDQLGSVIHYLDNEVVFLNDEWMLFGGTFWTDYDNHNFHIMYTAGVGMADHHVIKYIDSVGNWFKFSPEQAYQENEKARKALREALQKYSDKKFVIMTHHAPTSRSSHPKWGGTNNLLNYAYYNTRLDSLLDEYRDNIKYWVHGHTHDSHDYMHVARVICNPRGYEPNGLNPNFNVNKSFEV